jgi:predicted choloylglycine hydrolase
VSRSLRFRAIAEVAPGGKWQAHFRRLWPGYRGWFLSAGDAARPSYLQSRRALARQMPELVAIYDRLVELAGGGDLAARLLALYRPPPYLAGCSQIAWTRGGEGPLLVRNYDYAPARTEGVVLHTTWRGRQVIALSDCLWGVLDGINDAGLAVSLTFGGRRAVGEGFGIPLILRYVLETCETTAQATAALCRIPPHMAYNVTVLDRAGEYRTCHLSPDRSPEVRDIPLATNHQGRIEWDQHARASGTLEREGALLRHLADPDESAAGLVSAFLAPPLYGTGWERGFGTLYTALYRPREGRLALHWPGQVWHQSFDGFREGVRCIRYGEGAPRPTAAPGA